MFIIEILHIKRTRLNVNNEIGTKRLVHNKRMFILSEFIIIDPDSIIMNFEYKSISFLWFVTFA